MSVEDVSPIKYKKAQTGEAALVNPGSWWPQGDQKGFPWGSLLPASPRGGRTRYLEEFGEAGTSANIS